MATVKPHGWVHAALGVGSARSSIALLNSYGYYTKKQWESQKDASLSAWWVLVLVPSIKKAGPTQISSRPGLVFWAT